VFQDYFLQKYSQDCILYCTEIILLWSSRYISVFKVSDKPALLRLQTTIIVAIQFNYV